MRKLLILLALPLLTACGTVQHAWESYWLPPFDNREYTYAVELRSMSEVAVDQCATAGASRDNAARIHERAREFYNYARELPNNRDVESMARSITEITGPLHQRYTADGTVSAAYCRSKYQLINIASTGAQRAMARKKR